VNFGESASAFLASEEYRRASGCRSVWAEKKLNAGGGNSSSGPLLKLDDLAIRAVLRTEARRRRPNMKAQLILIASTLLLMSNFAAPKNRQRQAPAPKNRKRQPRK